MSKSPEEVAAGAVLAARVEGYFDGLRAGEAGVERTQERLRSALGRLRGLDYKYGGWWSYEGTEWTGAEDLPEELMLALHDFLALARGYLGVRGL